MAHTTSASSHCTRELGALLPARQWHRHHHQQDASIKLSNSPAIFLSPPPKKYRGQAKTTRRLVSVAALPEILSEPAVIGSHYDLTTFYNATTLDEKTLKNIYLCFSMFFVWGCCVFGSMKDPYYDSDVYRDAGGDGSGNWLYKLEEEQEAEAREELWREELAREIEERVEELKKLEEGEKEKEKELV